MNSEEFVNPPTRVTIFNEMKEEQRILYDARVSIITELNNQRPTEFSKKFVQDLEDKLR